MFDALDDEWLEADDVLRPSSTRDADLFWPTVFRVAAVGTRASAPVFRTVGRRLSQAGARIAATRMPGVFVRGTARQVRQFAQHVGGQLAGPERHGPGLPHYHLIRNGRRIHIWFGRQVPQGNFFE